ncbi:hypothetical protein DRN93_02375 [archaeon]|nr:MAG: hypothetical protein DRN93_02375 [archaeon]
MRMKRNTTNATIYEARIRMKHLQLKFILVGDFLRIVHTALPEGEKYNPMPVKMLTIKDITIKNIE